MSYPSRIRREESRVLDAYGGLPSPAWRQKVFHAQNAPALDYVEVGYFSGQLLHCLRRRERERRAVCIWFTATPCVIGKRTPLQLRKPLATCKSSKTAHT